MAERYVIYQRATGASASVEFPSLQVMGGRDLCAQLRGFLGQPAVVVEGRTAPDSGVRSSVVVELVPGSQDWLEERLSRAAEELGLDLMEKGP